MNPERVLEILNDPIARELLQSPLLCHLAYNGTDGTPRVIPTGYLWNGEHFVTCTAANAPKVRALRANPAVALTIDSWSPMQPPHVLLVRGTAAVEIVDGVPVEFLQTSLKALPPEQHAQFEAQSRAMYPQMARIAIAPTWAKILDFETRLPVAVEQLIKERS